MIVHAMGVDPGLVHTGVVRLMVWPEKHSIEAAAYAVAGPDASAVAFYATIGTPVGFIENFRPRSHYQQDEKMVNAVKELRKATGFKVLDNTGVKKVVRRPLLELLGLWNFSTPTHHQDLRSAARIMVLGLLKDETTNKILADIVADHMAGRTWKVSQL